MKKFKFFLALFSSKICLAIFKIIGRRQDDKPGSLALRIYPDFIKDVSKPKTVICVTGTNGKTTVSNLLANALIKLNKKVSYNDWGANTKIGVSRCLLDSVSIFNHSKKDICILETDEKSSSIIWPYVKPNYIIVTNICRDSMHRNAHPKYIFDAINKGIIDESCLILNADDPISSFLGTAKNKRVYYGFAKLPTDKKGPYNIINDFNICPICHHKIKYDYIKFNNIGKFKCPNCGLENKKADFEAIKVNYEFKKIHVKHNDVETVLPLLSDSLFNAYNVLAVITCLYTMGYSSDDVANSMAEAEIVKSRYSDKEINNIIVSTMVAKGLNAVAVSTVFDYIRSKEGEIEIILILDDQFDNKDGSEAISWIYDTDFEFLNQSNIKKIVVGGVRSKDYRLRLLLAGIPDEKIICCREELDTYKYVDSKNIDYIYILHDVYSVGTSRKLQQAIVEKINKESRAE